MHLTLTSHASVFPSCVQFCTCTFSSISAAVCLVTSRFSTRAVSPKKFPEAEERRESKLSSRVFKVILNPFCCFVRSDCRGVDTTHKTHQHYHLHSKHIPNHHLLDNLRLAELKATTEIKVLHRHDLSTP